MGAAGCHRSATQRSVSRGHACRSGGPGIDGDTICARIRANASLAAVPVLFVTANYAPVDRAAARSAGADDFLVKPFHPTMLLDKAKAMLSETR